MEFHKFRKEPCNIHCCFGKNCLSDDSFDYIHLAGEETHDD